MQSLRLRANFALVACRQKIAATRDDEQPNESSNRAQPHATFPVAVCRRHSRIHGNGPPEAESQPQRLPRLIQSEARCGHEFPTEASRDFFVDGPLIPQS
jgi:hypothetical protein